jgi:desulfoferrodoxin-like iron-binding protein
VYRVADFQIKDGPHLPALQLPLWKSNRHCKKFKERRNKMTEKGQIYKCDVCGNVVSVLEAGDGDLVCCGEDMRLLTGEEAQKY